MNEMKKKLEALLQPNLVLMDVIKDQHRPGVKLIVDSIRPMTINTTSDVARTVRDSGYLDQVFPDGYQLEVTSPGLEAPLKQRFQFEKNIGRKIELKLLNQLQGHTVKIIDVDETGLTGEDKTGGKEYIKFDQIETAKIVIEFK